MTSGLGDHANSEEFRPAVEDAEHGVSEWPGWRESRHSGRALASNGEQKMSTCGLTSGSRGYEPRTSCSMASTTVRVS